MVNRECQQGERACRRESLHGQPADISPSPSWRSMVEMLSGLGQAFCQLDGFRLHVPARIRRELGETLHTAWMCSFISSGCLRVIPEALWGEYVQLVRRQLASPELVYVLDTVIIPTATKLYMDGGGRWNVPPHLADRAGIARGCSCLLIVNQAWLDIWENSEWEGRLTKLLAAVDREKLLAPSASPVIPTPPSVGLSAPNESRPTRGEFQKNH